MKIPINPEQWLELLKWIFNFIGPAATAVIFTFVVLWFLNRKKSSDLTDIRARLTLLERKRR